MMSRRLADLGSPAMTLDGNELHGRAKLAALGVQHHGDKLALRLHPRPVDEPIPESCRIDVSQIAGCGAGRLARRGLPQSLGSSNAASRLTRRLHLLTSGTDRRRRRGCGPTVGDRGQQRPATLWSQ
jgi:hypothetical protein